MIDNTHSNRCNNFFAKGKLNFLIDTTQGSSGKGKIESFLIKNSDNCSSIITTNSANASHIVVEKGVEYLFKCLPSGALYHEKLNFIFIAPGAAFEIKTLFKEIEMCNIPHSKIKIHPKATIITQIDIDFEKGLCDLDGNYNIEQHDGTIANGSTCSGSGAASAKKVIRHKTSVLAGDVEELREFICNTEVAILELLNSGHSMLCQIGQGTPLSLNHWRFGKNTTYRNVTIGGALSDCFLPPSVVGNVLTNVRTFPIKIANFKQISRVESIDQIPLKTILEEEIESKLDDVALKYPPSLFHVELDETKENILVTSLPNLHVTGEDLDKFPNYPFDKVDSYSGDCFPDQQEITWEMVEESANVRIPDNVKRTTLTKLLRRCFTFSKVCLDEGFFLNMPPEPYKIFLSVNFANWIDNEMSGEREVVTKKFGNWLRENVYPITEKYGDRIIIGFIGTSAETDDTIINFS
jgi:hypothetical protein